MRLIGFTGPMGCGKSTAIECLRQLHGPTHLFKFAQTLYDLQELIYGRIEHVYQRPKGFVKDRKLLQWLGTDWGRETLSPTIWVDLWKADVSSTLEHYPRHFLVCDDVRFDNEADAIHELGGVVVSITADRALERITTANGIQNHKSEAGIRPELIDHVLTNNGTLDEFKTSLCKLYEQLGVGQSEPVA
jgi:energy-coupling factor transporter ATP-binding protein EcfA2